LVRKTLETGAKTRASFRDALSTLKGYDGATGFLSFTEKRETKRQLFILSITPKGLREVSVTRKPEG
jgi:hypothetical protein